MQSSLLAQNRPSVTTPVAVLVPTIRTELARIIVCNSTAAPVGFSLYHDDDGSTYDQSTALYYAKAVPANDSIVISADALGLGVSVAIGGSLAVQSATANALTFSIYGSTTNIAPNQSRI